MLSLPTIWSSPNRMPILIKPHPNRSRILLNPNTALKSTKAHIHLSLPGPRVYKMLHKQAQGCRMVNSAFSHSLLLLDWEQPPRFHKTRFSWTPLDPTKALPVHRIRNLGLR